VVHDALGAWTYPVHRLDRGASGVLALALTPEAARALGDAFAGGCVVKRYLALVRGVPPERGTIDHPVPRGERGGPRIEALTEYRRLEVFGRYSLVEVTPHTGRLHQIRRHLKHIACPLIGDVRYGKGEHNRLFRARHGLNRLALHAFSLELPHPESGDTLRVEAPLPDDLRRPMESLAAEAACDSS
jgi:tRNA pseudouridine65 synthase